METAMSRKRRLSLFLGVLAALIALFSVIYYMTRPAAVDGSKTITVEVIHQDASSKAYTYETTAEYLGEVLRTEKLVQGEQGPYGFYITEVDGEQAVFETDGAYWALYKGDTYASTGVDQTPVTDGDRFSLVYTAD